jgi:hypothetical protein
MPGPGVTARTMAAAKKASKDIGSKRFGAP